MVKLMSNSRLSLHVWALVSQIPKGKVTTYKMIAQTLHCKSYQAIGQILTRNTRLITLPCHRVVKSNGDVGGYALGIERKISILRDEGIAIHNQRIMDLNTYLFSFDDFNPL
jgi:methylated-DNA-[protein]-cysteine S-methyltransferase